MDTEKPNVVIIGGNESNGKKAIETVLNKESFNLVGCNFLPSAQSFGKSSMEHLIENILEDAEKRLTVDNQFDIYLSGREKRKQRRKEQRKNK